MKSTAASASFQECFFDLALGDYTGITSMDARLIVLLRRELIRLLDRVYPILVSLARESIEFEIGPCEGVLGVGVDSDTEILTPFLTGHHMSCFRKSSG